MDFIVEDNPYYMVKNEWINQYLLNKEMEFCLNLNLEHYFHTSFQQVVFAEFLVIRGILIECTCLPIFLKLISE